MTDKNAKPVVLRGMSFGWSCFHPRVYTKGIVKTLYKDWGCTVLRAALGVEPDKGYIKDSANSMKLIRTVVEAAIEQGIYVIIDWHSHNINLKEATAFLKQWQPIMANIPMCYMSYTTNQIMKPGQK